MKKILIICLILVFFQPVYAQKIILNHKDYDSAHSADKNILFYMESTKAGVITTSFEGVVKQGSIEYRTHKGKFYDVLIKIQANSLDTDNSARNDKMYEESLAVEKYPEITVSLKGPVLFNAKNLAKIKIHGKEYPITIFMNESHNKKQRQISGHANISLKELNIPDPSIWIASVRDLVEIKFNFVL